MQGMTVTINVDETRKCHECGKGWACQNNLCLPCNTKAISGKKMKSETGRVVQARFNSKRPNNY